jgi:ABC-type oligopeptide transport system substrate-binding subunit
MLAPSGRQAEARFLQSQWQECLGLAVNLELLDWASYLRQVRTRPPHLYFMGWAPDYSDPDNYLRIALARNSGWSEGAYWRLIDQARQTVDHKSRIKLYAQAEGILAQDAPILPLIYRRRHLLVKPSVKQFSVSATGDLFWKDVVIDRDDSDSITGKVRAHG